AENLRGLRVQPAQIGQLRQLGLHRSRGTPGWDQHPATPTGCATTRGIDYQQLIRLSGADGIAKQLRQSG
ncbi:MAG: hypothetical protein ACRDLF_16205, partial [Solirubrobacteraceae bacterium]